MVVGSVIQQVIGGPLDLSTNITNNVSLVLFLVLGEFTQLHEDFAANFTFVQHFSTTLLLLLPAGSWESTFHHGVVVLLNFLNLVKYFDVLVDFLFKQFKIVDDW